MKVNPDIATPDLDYVLIGDANITGTVFCGEDVKQFNLVYAKEEKVYLCVNNDPEKARPDALTLQSAKAGETCPVLIFGQLYCEDFDIPLGTPLWVSKNPGCIDATVYNSIEPGTFYVSVGAAYNKQEIFFQTQAFSVGGDNTVWEMTFLIKHLWSMSVLPGEFFQHYKELGTNQGCYGVLAVGKHTETEELQVVYMNHDDGKIWIRPEKMFVEDVEEGVKRFTPIDDIEDFLDDDTR
jgi:hypothetical protein